MSYTKSMNLSPLFNPKVRKSNPKPAFVNLQKIFLWGTALWVIATLISGILLFVFHMHIITLPFLTCVFGIIIGCCLLIWERWYRSEYTKLANTDQNEAEDNTSNN